MMKIMEESDQGRDRKRKQEQKETEWIDNKQMKKHLGDPER